MQEKLSDVKAELFNEIKELVLEKLDEIAEASSRQLKDRLDEIAEDVRIGLSAPH